MLRILLRVNIAIVNSNYGEQCVVDSSNDSKTDKSSNSKGNSNTNNNWQHLGQMMGIQITLASKSQQQTRWGYYNQ